MFCGAWDPILAITEALIWLTLQFFSLLVGPAIGIGMSSAFINHGIWYVIPSILKLRVKVYRILSITSFPLLSTEFDSFLEASTATAS